MSVLRNLLGLFGRSTRSEELLPGENLLPNTEVGQRSTYEDRVSRIYSEMAVSYGLRNTILDLRNMWNEDGRVKRITGRTVRAATKGGLRLETASSNRRLTQIWKEFQRRTGLHDPQKLDSDMRGLFLEGNLPLQVVLDGTPRVLRLVRMPAETILPRVGRNGVFNDVTRAYDQVDIGSNKVIASFALWQLILTRLDPSNVDDWGAMGRPYLDASRKVWRQLLMTEEDLVLRRRMRAPVRMAHVLEGADDEELAQYQAKVERDQQDGNWRDYYMNKKGAVNAVQGDANLDEIKDVVHLLDTFFSGGPAPKALFGYTDGLNRDILEDLKRDFYDELDRLQDTAAQAYDRAFRLELLLRGINPDGYDFEVGFAERRTETPNQAADRALKYGALGASRQTVWRTAGLDPARELDALADERDSLDPYPDEPPEDPGGPRVSVTPGNARKGESATTISTRSGNR